jgi:hypothetical protein
MALEIFRLVGSVFVDTADANKSMQKTDKNAGKLGETVVKGIKSIGKFAAGIAAAATAAGAALVGLAESTREYRTEQGKLLTAFEMQNFSAEQARTTYSALNGVLGDSGQAVEASNHLAMLANNEEDLAKWTNICTGVYATFGDSLPIENLTEASNETAKTGKITGGLADALNWAGVNEEKFQEQLDKCSNEQERQALITKTLNGLYSEAADAYRENNAEVIAANEAQDKLNNSLAKIGAAVEPVLTKGKELIATVLEKAAPMLANLAEYLIPVLTGAFNFLVDAVSATVQWFQDAYTWMQENETIVTLIAIAVGTLTAALIAYTIQQNAATISTKLATAATTIATAATSAWGAAVAFLTSPITLTVAAIGALIAIIYLLVTNWDTVSATAVKCWEWIKETWSKVAEWFDTNVIQPVVGFFVDLGQTISQAFTDAWNWCKNAWSAAGNFFSGIWTSIKNAFGSVASWFRDTFTKAWTNVKNVFSTGGKIFDGIKDGIANVFKTVVNKIIGGINKVIAVPFNAINKILKKIKGIDILGLKPFSWVTTFSVPQIPQLEAGAVLEKGQVGLLEGNGAEAVVPLHQNRKWISAVARDMDSALGGSDQVVAVLLDILAAIEALTGLGIFLDKDTLVGELARPLDRKLGQIQAAKGRA